jgi:hypothetical protein
MPDKEACERWAARHAVKLDFIQPDEHAERGRRELQRALPRRVSLGGTLSHGGACSPRDRALAGRLQHAATSQRAGIHHSQDVCGPGSPESAAFGGGCRRLERLRRASTLSTGHLPTYGIPLARGTHRPPRSRSRSCATVTLTQRARRSPDNDQTEGALTHEVLGGGGDYFDDEERARPHASIGRGIADVRAGRTVDGREVIARLRARAAHR